MMDNLLQCNRATTTKAPSAPEGWNTSIIAVPCSSKKTRNPSEMHVPPCHYIKATSSLSTLIIFLFLIISVHLSHSSTLSQFLTAFPFLKYLYIVPRNLNLTLTVKPNLWFSLLHGAETQTQSGNCWEISYLPRSMIFQWTFNLVIIAAECHLSQSIYANTCLEVREPCLEAKHSFVHAIKRATLLMWGLKLQQIKVNIQFHPVGNTLCWDVQSKNPSVTNCEKKKTTC